MALVEAGAKGILFADILEHGAQEAAEESQKNAKHLEYCAVHVKMDVTDQASVQSMVDTAIKEFGRIDYNVNSAGVSVDGDLTKVLLLT